MRSRLRDFLVGVTSIIALSGFAVLLLLFGELADLWQKRYPIVIRANTTAGLRVGSQVTVNGVVVGTVSLISLERADPDHPVRIEAMVDEAIGVPLAARPTVGMTLLGGGQRIDLEIPRDAAPDAELARKSGPPSILLGQFETLGDFIAQVSDGVRDARAAIASAQGALDKVGASLSSVGPAAEQAQRTLVKAEEWLADEQFREDLRGTLFNARQATATIARVVENLEKDAPRLVSSLTKASDQLSETLVEVDALLRQAREGQGTIGRLMSNPELYQSLDDASKRLSSVLRQAQLLLERVREEGLDVKFK